MDKFQEGYEAGLKAAEDKLKIEFSDAKDKEIADLEKKFADEKESLVKEKDAKIKELEDVVKSQENQRFSDEIQRVTKNMTQDEKEKAEKELKEFSELLPFDKFVVVAGKYEKKEIEIPEEKKFSEEPAAEVDEFNSNAR